MSTLRKSFIQNSFISLCGGIVLLCRRFKALFRILLTIVSAIRPRKVRSRISKLSFLRRVVKWKDQYNSPMSGTVELSARDALVLLLWSPGVTREPGEPIAGRTRITKGMFLFEKEVWPKIKTGRGPQDTLFDFHAWKFGPYSSQVLDSLEFLELHGVVCSLVESQSEDDLVTTASMSEWYEYVNAAGTEYPRNEAHSVGAFAEPTFSLTPKGMQICEKYLLPKFSNSQLNSLFELKLTIQVPLRALLRLVYNKYPDYTENSEIKEDVLGK